MVTRRYIQIVEGRGKIVMEYPLPPDHVPTEKDLEEKLKEYIRDTGETVKHWLNQFLHDGKGESQVKRVLGDMVNLSVQATVKYEKPIEVELIPEDERVSRLDPLSPNFQVEVKGILASKKEGREAKVKVKLKKEWGSL